MVQTLRDSQNFRCLKLQTLPCLGSASETNQKLMYMATEFYLDPKLNYNGYSSTHIGTDAYRYQGSEVAD